VFTGAVFWFHAAVNVGEGGTGEAEKSGFPHVLVNSSLQFTETEPG
jgi:hypothetical protein